MREIQLFRALTLEIRDCYKRGRRWECCGATCGSTFWNIFSLTPNNSQDK